MGLKTINGRNIDMADTTYVNTQITAAEKDKLKGSGSIFFAELPERIQSNVGKVYNIKNDFITSDDFLEGKGHEYVAGSNIAIVNIGDQIYYDVIGGNDDYNFASDEEVNDIVDNLYKE